MAQYKKLYNPKKCGFKNHTRGGHRAYIYRTDITNKKGAIEGVVLDGVHATIRTWKDNGGYYSNGLESPYDLIPLKDRKAHFNDLTKIDVPFGELDKDTQRRLKEWSHGIEVKNDSSGWLTINALFDSEATVYRAIPEPVEKPKPEYEVGRWYPWSGGECPLSGDTMVNYITQGESESESLVKYLDWSKIGCNTDIISFKVVSYA